MERKPINEQLTPEQRIPTDIRELLDDGLPDFYDGPLHAGPDSAERAAREIGELIDIAQKKAEHGERKPEDEIAPLPPGFGDHSVE